MAGLRHAFDQNRFISNIGGVVGATVYFYYTGTTNPAPIYNDKNLTISATNPVVIAGGALVPDIFLDSSIQYRRRIVFSDATVYDVDPISVAEGLSALLAATSGAALIGTVNDGTVQQAITNTPKFSHVVSYPNSTIGSKLKQTPSVKDAPYSATGDGTTDDRGSFVSADGTGSFVVPPGSYRIASNLTISSNIKFLPGAVLIIPNGVTVAFNGYFDAGVHQTFSCTGSGKVVFNWIKTWRGFAEWWGAKADLSVDCSPAINAAIIALLTTQLQAGDYLCNSTLFMRYDHRALIGAGSKYSNIPNTVTRILTADGSSYAMQVGPDAFPGSINACQKNNLVKDLYFNRLVNPVISSNCVGLEVQYTLMCRVQNVKVAESIIGFRSYGNITPKFDDCESVRSVAGTGAGTDYWRGYWIDGGASIGAAGGNASVYMWRCAAGCNIGALGVTTGNGFYIDQAFTDIFLDHPETVGCYNGIYLAGNSATGNTFSNTDMFINHPIMDQFHNAGIFVTQVAEAGSVEINNPYCGPAGDARASIWINASTAAVTITGGQLVHGGANNVQPVLILNSSGVQLLGTMILEAGTLYSAVGLSNAQNCVIRPTLKNRAVTGQAAVQLSTAVSGCIIQPIVMGKTSAFTYGIQVVGAIDARNEYNLSGIDSLCINAGSGNKLVRNGTQITVTGLSGSNLVSGVMT